MRISLVLLVFTLLLSTCVDPFDPGIDGKGRKLVVDGLITNLPDIYTVRLTYSEPYNNDSLTLPVTNAKVYVTDDFKNQYNFSYTTQGNYVSELSFQGKIGNIYTLHIQTPDGKKYASQSEKMLAPTPIDTIFSRFVETTDSRGVTTYAFDAVLRTTDSKEVENYYQWRWTHYKQLEFCLQDRDPRTLAFRKFSCCDSCWSVTRCRGNACNQVESDVYFNGNRFEYNVAKVPFDSKEAYFIVVDQLALSESTYRFWKTVNEQLNNTGGIFDVPPAAAIGNIFASDNAEETVLGIFNVTGAVRKSAYLDRSNVARQPLEKITIPGTVQRECVACEEGRVRTGKKPPGWAR